MTESRRLDPAATLPTHREPGRKGNRERKQSVLISALAQVLARRVLSGPFRGMGYLGRSPGGSTLMPKVLGTYEKEIWESIASLLDGETPGIVVDIGAGEGYYVTGLVWSGRAARAVAYEADDGRRDLLAQLAKRNNVADRVEIRGYCGPEVLVAAIDEIQPSLLIIDVEGGEVGLLDGPVVERLAKTNLVVEIHPWVNADAGAILRQRFASTHDVAVIPARVPVPADIRSLPFRWLASLHPRIAKRLLQERPEGMSWLVIRSRSAGQS